MQNRFELLRMFRVVASFKTLADAAIHTKTLPTAISQNIRQLETSIGEALLVRDTPELVLTEFGKTLADQSEFLMTEFDKLFAEA